MRLAGRLALPTTGQETSLGRAKLPLSRRTSLACTELRSFGCGCAALGAMQASFCQALGHTLELYGKHHALCASRAINCQRALG